MLAAKGFAEIGVALSLDQNDNDGGGMAPVRILIADDHEVVRRGLRSLLSTRPEWHVCGEAVDGTDAVQKTKALKPDVLVLDVTMPHLNGLEAARLIRRDVP
jgi:DNA-binding NarL/FixJ family response regulator